MDSFTQRAFEVLASRRVFEALDLTKEDPGLRARYGVGDMTQRRRRPPLLHGPLPDGPPPGRGRSAGRDDLVRPLGYPQPELRDGHGTVSPSSTWRSRHWSKTCIVRGLDKDVSVVVWGEFGRTPKINKNAGRDHWPAVNFALLAGGGMRTGQVIGSTDKDSRLRQGPARLVPERLRHALPQPRHRPRHRRRRPKRPADVLARRARADPRVDLITRLTDFKASLAIAIDAQFSSRRTQTIGTLALNRCKSNLLRSTF